MGSMSGAAGYHETDKPGGIPWSEQSPAWRVISQRYAKAASGDVTCVVGKVPVGESAILREEVETLKANKKVTSIRAGGRGGVEFTHRRSGAQRTVLRHGR
jgi:hypothetical protein